MHYALSGKAEHWGCGVDFHFTPVPLELGEEAIDPPYAGSSTEFRVLHSNSTSAPVRMSYVQSLSSPPQSAPYVEGHCTNDVHFLSVACPSEAGADCVAPGPHPYRLQVQVVGGRGPAESDLCIAGPQPPID